MRETFDLINEIQQFFNGCAGTWDDFCRYDPHKIAAIVTLADIVPGSRVADIACGTGVLIPEMLSRNPKEVLGVDLSDCMIAKARGKFADPRLRFLAADIFDVRDTGFDTAMIFSAYPHFQDKQRLARKVYSMLKTGGRIMIAHCEGRNAINQCHMGKTVNRISWPLRSVKEEADEFSGYFTMDILADTADMYLISGIKK